MNMFSRIVPFARMLSALALLALAGNARAGDWPQFRGPNRDGVSPETGLLRAWPEAGPPLDWSIEGIGAGYGSPAVVGDRIYVQGTSGEQSVVFALRASDGAQLWMAALGPMLEQDQGGGPRSTPTVDGERLYALTENGDLACLRTSDGGTVWAMNMLEKFGGGNPNWHISESPLVEGDKLIVCPGGEGAGIVALNKASGETIWKSDGLSGLSSYASAVAAEVDGKRIVMNFSHAFGFGVSLDDGKLLWSYAKPANGTANCTSPVVVGDKVMFSSAYDTGTGTLELVPKGEGVDIRELYFTKDMENHHGGLVSAGEHVYGFSGPALTCLKFDTGERIWRDRSVGKGSLIVADGLLFLLGENNTMGLADASPEGYVERGRFSIPDRGRPSWAHPSLSNGRLYIRNQTALMRFAVAASPESPTILP